MLSLRPTPELRSLRAPSLTFALLAVHPRAKHGLSEWYHQTDNMRREHEWLI
jgi:hypothetical protein